MRWTVPAILVLAGCQGTEDPCGAAGYRALVGTNVAAVTLPAELNARIVGPDTAVTMDFDPTRLNVRTDAEGVVTGLTCG